MTRPPQDADNPRSKTVSCRVSEEVLTYLRDVGTREVEDCIRKTQKFRKWRELNGKKRS